MKFYLFATGATFKSNCINTGFQFRVGFKICPGRTPQIRIHVYTPIQILSANLSGLASFKLLAGASSSFANE